MKKLFTFIFSLIIFSVAAQHETVLYENNLNALNNDSVFSDPYKQFALTDSGDSTYSFDGSPFLRATDVDNIFLVKPDEDWVKYDSVVLQMNLFYKSTYAYGHKIRVTSTKGPWPLDSTYRDLVYGTPSGSNLFRFNFTKYISAENTIEFLYVRGFSDPSWFCFIDNLKITGYSGIISGTDKATDQSPARTLIKATDLNGREYSADNLPEKGFFILLYSDGNREKVMK
jgi:hypothetical protein